MSVILYEHPLSPYAQKVKIALLEKGVPFEPRLPDFFGGDATFAAASPRLEVPALLDGDTAVFDSTISLEYIEDRWPAPPLLPRGAAERARVRMIEELCDTYYEAINWAVYEIRVFERATGELAARLLARARRAAVAQRRGLRLGRSRGAPRRARRRPRRQPPAARIGPRRLARAGARAAQRGRGARGRRRVDGGLRDAAAARGLGAVQARVPRPPPRVDAAQRRHRDRARGDAPGDHPLLPGARLGRRGQTALAGPDGLG